jgi:hypothetical protein
MNIGACSRVLCGVHWVHSCGRAGRSWSSGTRRSARACAKRAGRGGTKSSRHTGCQRCSAWIWDMSISIGGSSSVATYRRFTFSVLLFGSTVPMQVPAGLLLCPPFVAFEPWTLLVLELPAFPTSHHSTPLFLLLVEFSAKYTG